MSELEPTAASATAPAAAAAAAPWWLIAIAVAVLGGIYAYAAGGFPLSEPDEARYAEIARELLVRGDWVTPTLNFVKYFEKPPFVYWATASAFRIVGINEFAARLPSLLSALATIALVAWMAGRMYGRRAGLLTAGILATGPFPAMLGQTLTLDMTLTFFTTAALVATWVGAERPSLWWYRCAYVATAFGVLTKGPVAAVLVGGTAAVFLLLEGGWRAVKRAIDPVGLALAALIILPWFILVSWRNPEFPEFFFVDQHVKRYLSTREHREPIWFYLPILPVALFPWSLLPFVDPATWRPYLDPRRWSAATRFLVLWAAVVLVFFSLSSSKLLTYILPALPPLAALLGRLFADALNRNRRAFCERGGSLLLGIGAATALAAVIVPLVVQHWRAPLVAPYLGAAGVILIATGIFMRRAVQRHRLGESLAILTAGAIGFLAVGVCGRELVTNYRHLGQAAGAALRPGDRLAVYGHYVSAIPFYSGQRVIMIRSWGELKFGSQQGDQSAYFWPSDEQLRHAWRSSRRLLLVINRNELAELHPPLDPPPTELAAEGKKVLIVNQADGAPRQRR